MKYFDWNQGRLAHSFIVDVQGQNDTLTKTTYFGSINRVDSLMLRHLQSTTNYWTAKHYFDFNANNELISDSIYYAYSPQELELKNTIGIHLIRNLWIQSERLKLRTEF